MDKASTVRFAVPIGTILGAAFMMLPRPAPIFGSIPAFAGGGVFAWAPAGVGVLPFLDGGVLGRAPPAARLGGPALRDAGYSLLAGGRGAALLGTMQQPLQSGLPSRVEKRVSRGPWHSQQTKHSLCQVCPEALSTPPWIFSPQP